MADARRAPPEGPDRRFRRTRADRRGAVLATISRTRDARRRGGRAEGGRSDPRRHHGSRCTGDPAAIAIAADAAATNGSFYDAAIALGCADPWRHHPFPEIVSQESSRALMDLAVARKLPLGNGILTVNTEAQAWRGRAPASWNKGGDAARAAIAMLRA
ncbi:6,7-dimethyl-8-ribityllumazine synthase [Bradyrhizobium sp. 2]|uniref:6,7-dimethyl-8-ribityllumazine synthase n=1 Tax=Bradyrhizobium sp. 2 TaxID=190045 RepID=UPI001FF9150C|nr:6,7-dimethyl-8-ribityllumazine synthase [Bradyrhizobium sp. 2]